MSTSKNNEVEAGVFDPLSKFGKLKFILPIAGAIILLALTFNPIGALFGAGIGFLASYLLIQGIAAIQLAKLNLKDYPLPSPVTAQQLYEYLSKSFSNPDIELEKINPAIGFRYKGKTEHILILNEKKQTYSITSKMTTKARIKRGGKSNSATEYRNAIIVVPIIQKAVENAVIASKTPVNS